MKRLTEDLASVGPSTSAIRKTAAARLVDGWVLQRRLRRVGRGAREIGPFRISTRWSSSAGSIVRFTFHGTHDWTHGAEMRPSTWTSSEVSRTVSPPFEKGFRPPSLAVSYTAERLVRPLRERLSRSGPCPMV